MKAPERPNKIYVPVVTSELTNLQYIRYDLASTKPTTYSRDHIEYIRKDALLEFLYQIIEHNGNKEAFVPRGAVAACKDIITYINSL